MSAEARVRASPRLKLMKSEGDEKVGKRYVYLFRSLIFILELELELGLTYLFGRREQLQGLVYHGYSIGDIS